MTQRLRLHHPLVISLFALAALMVLSYFPLSRIRAASAGATILPSAGKPLVNFRAPQTAKVTYTGAADAVAALRAGSATPTALAAADFNADGAPDVVAGYSTANGGVLVLYKGNPDAFAPTDTSLYQKAIKGNVPPTFLAQAAAFSLNESPDLIATGDFNLDGHQDVLAGARGGNLYFLAGDGKGGLLAPQMLSVAGAVRGLAVNMDGHVAVSLDGSNGPELEIFAPGMAGLKASATYPLPARGDSVAWGTLGGNVDIAVGAGSNVAIIYGALTSNWQAETVTLPYQVKGLALGDYVSDADYRTEIAVLADDGSIHILQHGTSNTAPPTAAERAARRAASVAVAKGKKVTPPAFNPTALGAWTEAKKLPYNGSAPASTLSASAFNTPHLAASTTHDLMVVDAGKSQINILDTSGKASSPSAGISFSGTPVAALALPQKIDASRDIVVLTSSQSAPILAIAPPDAAYTVTWTTDEDDVNACDTNVTSGAGNDGQLSLREAVCEAGNSSGSVSVSVPSGTYDLASGVETGELFLGNSHAVTLSIVGAGSTTIIQQTDGKHRVMEQDPQGIGGIVVSLSNLTLTGGDCTVDDGSQFGPNDCSLGGGAFLGDGPNDNTTITSVTMSGNQANPSGNVSGGGQDFGGALSHYGPNLSIMNSSFSSNTASGDGGGVAYECCGNGNGNFAITNSSFTNNTLTTPAAGGGLNAIVVPGFGASSIGGSTFTGNTATSDGGGISLSQENTSGTAGAVTVSNSRIVGNHAGTGVGQGGTGIYTEFIPANINNNWWGCNGGPGASGCDTFLNDQGTVTLSTWLQLSISANPTQVDTNATSTLTADLTHNSANTGGFSVPNGTPITFGETLGSVNPTSTTLTGGQATSTYTAGGTAGSGSGTATVDSTIVSVGITIGAPPQFTSGSSTTFTVGTNGSFPVSASGSPAPTITQTGGSTPSGVSFSGGSGSGTLSGTPAAGTGGVYSLTFGASNGFGSPATQGFTLTIDQAPVINSASSASFTFDTFGNFTVTTAAGTYPMATFSKSGSLPNGVTFSDSGVLSGTPTQAGSFPITITASNGVGSAATQSFTLNVSQGSTSISVMSVNPSSEVYGYDQQITITAVLMWTGNGPTPTASDVTIGGNGPSGSYSGTSCGAPSGDTMTCSATYTPSGADIVGTYTESATFTGDSNYTGSSSSQMNNFSITQATSSTSVMSGTNPSGFGQAVTFTATINGEYGMIVRQGPPGVGAALSGGASKKSGLRTSSLRASPALGFGGTVTWSPNTGCGMTTVSGNPGSTQCTTSILPEGDNTITASYSGDGNHSGSSGILSGGQQVNGPQVMLTPSSMNFGNVHLGSMVSQTVMVQNTGNASLTITGVSLTGKGNNTEYRMKNHCPATLLAGKSCEVDVFFTANQIGSRSNTLSVTDNAPGSPQQAGFTATVINPLASFNPTMVNFGTVKQGHSKTTSVTISNTGTTELTISSVAITGTDMNDFGETNACTGIVPGRSCVVKVTFTPTMTGSRSADLTVMDNTQAGTKNIPLMGTGD